MDPFGGSPWGIRSLYGVLPEGPPRRAPCSSDPRRLCVVANLAPFPGWASWLSLFARLGSPSCCARFLALGQLGHDPPSHATPGERDTTTGHSRHATNAMLHMAVSSSFGLGKIGKEQSVFRGPGRPWGTPGGTPQGDPRRNIQMNIQSNRHPRGPTQGAPQGTYHREHQGTHDIPWGEAQDW